MNVTFLYFAMFSPHVIHTWHGCLLPALCFYALQPWYLADFSA